MPVVSILLTASFVCLERQVSIPHFPHTTSYLQLYLSNGLASHMPVNGSLSPFHLIFLSIQTLGLEQEPNHVQLSHLAPLVLLASLPFSQAPPSHFVFQNAICTFQNPINNDSQAQVASHQPPLAAEPVFGSPPRETSVADWDW
jgi:hypothetical protein